MLKDLLQLEIIMVLLALTGVWLRRRGIITDQGRDCLTDVLMTVILPCNIFLSFKTDADMETLRSFLVTIVISVLVMLFTAVLGKAMYGRKEDHQQKVFRYGLINSNVLFIGLPIIQSLLGDAGVLQQTMYMIFVRVFCWSYGLSLYTGVKSDWKASAKRLMTNACMIAAALGLVMMLTGFRLPVFLDRTLGYASNCMMLISMLLIGVVLSEMDVRQLLRKDVWGFTAVRLLVIPAVVLLGCKLFRVPYIVTATCTLLSGMPAASLTAVLAARYHGDSELGALLVTVSTILSAMTIPIWFIILQ
ncbi:AEC family transporter [Dysosmobacter sp.]|uniref:AEC family transporter n=1 Tax=Dysosmobacter sp. TaxID=2591382 RepID=UPI002A8F252F|nr:AEC family transporter [Dysosmobacter sp.]MDY3985555.1 AEC family transporter [Dysosmobacter sp.]